MSRTGYLWDTSYLGHKTWSYHVERPERIKVLEQSAMLRDVPGLVSLKLDEGLGYPALSSVHTADYINEVRTAFANNIRTLDKRETVVSEDTYDVSLLAVAGALSVVAAVGRGRVDNGFAAIRPPGHHAGRGNARGFCIFNNAALCARFAQRAYGFERVMIVDWDVHPGDGTAAIFYEDPSVFVFSIHQDGIFTGSVGTPEQRGREAGEGFTMNVPLAAHLDAAKYLQAFERGLDRAASDFKPQLIIVSCGFDAHAGDPVGSMTLQESDFVQMTKMVRSIANEHAQGRLVSLLEGGYSPAVVRRCTVAHLEALMD